MNMSAIKLLSSGRNRLTKQLFLTTTCSDKMRSDEIYKHDNKYVDHAYQEMLKSHAWCSSQVVDIYKNMHASRGYCMTGKSEIFYGNGKDEG
jgi:hypothetical protein